MDPRNFSEVHFLLTTIRVNMILPPQRNKADVFCNPAAYKYGYLATEKG